MKATPEQKLQLFVRLVEILAREGGLAQACAALPDGLRECVHYNGRGAAGIDYNRKAPYADLSDDELELALATAVLANAAPAPALIDHLAVDSIEALLFAKLKQSGRRPLREYPLGAANEVECMLRLALQDGLSADDVRQNMQARLERENEEIDDNRKKRATLIDRINKTKGQA